MKIRYFWSKILKKLRGPAVRNSVVHKTSKVESGTQFINSVMGKHSFCGYDCDINNTEIGAFCSIANGVAIGGGMHPVDWISTSPVFYKGRDSITAKFSVHNRKPILPVVIGNDVWIGQNSIIKQGVVIGNGAVIGMGSIVTKDVAPYAIVGGNPAKLIRFRFCEEMNAKLNCSEWWDLDDKVLANIGKYSNNPKAFLEEFEKVRTVLANKSGDIKGIK